jgi:hypothetical protein
VQVHILMTALTDFATGRHHCAQGPVLFGRNVLITRKRVALGDTAAIDFRGGDIDLRMHGADYSLSLGMRAVKPPVWHCGDGVLKMGLDDPGETTFSWSYTNLAVSATLTLGGHERRVSGKAWFDKQGGTYTLTSRWTNWEWFSLRFFDDEEAMLFSFPQDDCRDGTCVERSGASRRLNDYRIEPLGFIEVGGRKFSSGWKVLMPGVKDGACTIVPKIDGQLNLFYFELLADVKDRRGADVGLCVVELPPGVCNEIRVRDAFARRT